MYYKPDTIVYLNGNFIKAVDATCSLYSQTLHYGIGVFEGLRSYQTKDGAKIFKVKEHFERLLKNADTMNIPCDYTVEELIQIAYLLLDKNDLEEAYIRPMLYLEDNLGLRINKNGKLFMAAFQWEKLYGDKHLNVYISSYSRPSSKAFHVESKTNGHYVNSILASTEARQLGYDEAILLDQQGNVAGGAAANIFIEKNGRFCTPPLGTIFPGITRKAVLEMCAARDIEVVERNFSKEELFEAEAAFFTGTAAEVIGINSVNRIPYEKDFDKTLTFHIEKDFKTFVRNIYDTNYTII
jgi:branched-chain amino acid aminotransferase